MRSMCRASSAWDRSHHHDAAIGIGAIAIDSTLSEQRVIKVARLSNNSSRSIAREGGESGRLVLHADTDAPMKRSTLLAPSKSPALVP